MSGEANRKAQDDVKGPKIGTKRTRNQLANVSTQEHLDEDQCAADEAM